MSTHARIAIKIEKESGEEYKSVYLHSDGYLSWAGKKLLNNYNSQELAKSLIDLGGLSQLNDTLEDTVSYYKWRNESKNIHTSYSLNALIKYTMNSEDYLYVFQENNWYYIKIRDIENLYRDKKYSMNLLTEKSVIE